ncbi:hypothetical protein FNF31_05656 [Cafeteria roenbergensis]|uniref:Sec1 family domain-containing protein 1 n=2 Tax=Cafeteria roenbergensis TaxID=33653 RepID=A0A5A8CYQ8_CAFRO|nr:hypothetical protein FNF31_05656 [Cafeteria roenbergensis]KAA0161173.1 hypothetical protein FNF28_05168 [Cafeteria roenbergensis]
MDLRACQRAFALHALRFNELGDGEHAAAGAPARPGGGSAAGAPWAVAWKVLVMDTQSRHVLSHLFPAAELRRLGATLHLALDSAREPVPGVPAVYVAEPTRAAFDRIASDCALGLYSAAHVNLTAEPTPEQIDYLAKAAVEAGGAARLAGLHSHPLRFRCPGPRTLCLGMPRATATLLAVGPGADAAIGAALTRIADGICSAFTALGFIPAIAAHGAHGPARAAAGLLAERLAAPGFRASHAAFSRIRAAGGAGGPGGVGLGPRPLLVLVDRMQDVASGLAHPSTYAALVAETMEVSSDGTRVKVPHASLPGSAPDATAADAAADGSTVTMDLDPATDAFWAQAAGLAFGDAVELQAKELQDVKTKEAALRADASAAGGSLSDAMQRLPALMQQKARLEAHTKLMTAVLSEVARRGLSDLFELERAPSKAAVLRVLRGEGADGSGCIGDLSDRARLACCFAVSSAADGTPKEIDELCAALETGASSLPPPPRHARGSTAAEAAGSAFSALGATLGSLVAGANSESAAAEAAAAEGAAGASKAVAEARRLAAAIRWVERHRRESATMAVEPTPDHAAAASAHGASAPSALGRSLMSAITGVTRSLVSKGAEAMARLAGGDTIHPATRFAAAAAGDAKVGVLPSSGAGSSLVFVDPTDSSSMRSLATGAPSKSAAPGGPYTSVMVFMVGGITQGEMTNIAQWGSMAAGRAVASGGTEVTTGRELVEELAALGGGGAA